MEKNGCRLCCYGPAGNNIKHHQNTNSKQTSATKGRIGDGEMSVLEILLLFCWRSCCCFVVGRRPSVSDFGCFRVVCCQGCAGVDDGGYTSCGLRRWVDADGGLVGCRLVGVFADRVSAGLAAAIGATVMAMVHFVAIGGR